MNKRKPAESIGLDDEQYRDLIRIFIENTRKELIEIKEALAQKDINNIEKLIHSFKGAALNLGLDEIAEDAEFLRYIIRNNEEVIKAQQIINKILQDMNSLAQSV